MVAMVTGCILCEVRAKAEETVEVHVYNTSTIHKKQMETFQQMRLTLGLPSDLRRPLIEAVEKSVNITAEHNMTGYRDEFYMKYVLRKNQNVGVQHDRHGFRVRLTEDDDKWSTLLLRNIHKKS
jgi:hypothetical protein